MLQPALRHLCESVDQYLVKYLFWCFKEIDFSLNLVLVVFHYLLEVNIKCVGLLTNYDEQRWSYQVCPLTHICTHWHIYAKWVKTCSRITLFCFPRCSVLWILNMNDKYCVCVCACGFLHARSIVFVLDMFVLNLSKHYYLGKQSFVCNTNRLITVFWFFITLVNSLLLKRFRGKAPVHFAGSLTKLTYGKALDKDSILCVTNLYADITIDVYLSCAHGNHKSH